MKTEIKIKERLNILKQKAKEMRYRIEIEANTINRMNMKDVLNDIEASISELRWVLNIGDGNKF